MKKHTLFITQTAVMIALLLGIQFITRPLGQLITGSLVNMILLTSLFILGISSGLTVGIMSPFLAFLVGIGPAFPQIIPFMAVGNAIIVLMASFVRRHAAKKDFKDIVITVAGLFIASIAKFLFLWIGLVTIALPLIPGIKEQQAAIISAAFSWPQLVTALVGSSLAMMVVPLLKRAKVKAS